MQNNECPEIPEEETPEKTLMCRAYAQFIHDESSAIDEPFFYLAAGSLFFLTMIDIQEYCAILLACSLVNCKQTASSAIKVEWSEGMWKKFWDRYQLGVDGDGCSEATQGEFYYDALKDKDTKSKVDGESKEDSMQSLVESRRKNRQCW